jgi:hypothetical protein
VRAQPPGVREKKALKELYAIKDLPPRHVKGAGPDTMERLEARGFVRTVGEVSYFPMYEMTPAGEAECLKISNMPI